MENLNSIILETALNLAYSEFKDPLASIEFVSGKNFFVYWKVGSSWKWVAIINDELYTVSFDTEFHVSKD